MMCDSNFNNLINLPLSSLPAPSEGFKDIEESADTGFCLTVGYKITLKGLFALMCFDD